MYFLWLLQVLYVFFIAESISRLGLTFCRQSFQGEGAASRDALFAQKGNPKAGIAPNITRLALALVLHLVIHWVFSVYIFVHMRL